MLVPTHAVPFPRAGFEHVPPLHVPALWHWSLAVHTIAVPAHVPPVHMSFIVQALPSSHSVPFAAIG